MANTAPYFEESKLVIEFRLKVGMKLTYTLPEAIDREQNDESEVYLSCEEGQINFFPPFLTFYNYTNVLELEPDSKTFAGHGYAFTIVAKEKNSDFNKNVYLVRVIILSLDASEEKEKAND